MNISDDLIRKHLSPFGFIPSSEQIHQIRAYADLLVTWNKKMSLTTIIEPAEMLRIHFGESIFAATSGIIEAGRLADVGSGAGFPGFPLAIAAPKLEVTLIEPNLKKTVFLSEVKRELHLENARIIRASMNGVGPGEFDYIAARALGRFAELLDFASEHVGYRGKVLFWLGEEDARKLMGLPQWRWHEPRSLPLSDRRCVLMGERHIQYVAR